MGRKILSKEQRKQRKADLKELEECVLWHHYMVSAVIVAPLTFRVTFDDGKEVLCNVVEITNKFYPQCADGMDSLYDPEVFQKYDFYPTLIEWETWNITSEALYYNGDEVIPPQRKFIARRLKNHTWIRVEAKT